MLTYGGVPTRRQKPLRGPLPSLYLILTPEPWHPRSSIRVRAVQRVGWSLLPFPVGASTALRSSPGFPHWPIGTSRWLHLGSCRARPVLRSGTVYVLPVTPAVQHWRHLPPPCSAGISSLAVGPAVWLSLAAALPTPDHKLFACISPRLRGAEHSVPIYVLQATCLPVPLASVLLSGFPMTLTCSVRLHRRGGNQVGFSTCMLSTPRRHRAPPSRGVPRSLSSTTPASHSLLLPHQPSQVPSAARCGRWVCPFYSSG